MLAEQLKFSSISSWFFNAHALHALLGIAHSFANSVWLQRHLIGGVGFGFSQLSTRWTTLLPPVRKVLSARWSSERSDHLM